MADQVTAVSHTEAEILSQPTVWGQTLASLDLSGLAQVWPSDQPDVLVTGCGSTYYLSLVMADLLRDEAGIPARAVPASELLPGASRQGVALDRTVLIVFSRSGTTTETVLAAENFRRTGGGRLLVVTAEPNTPLAAAADWSFAAMAGTEQSVAQTRSFTSMLLVGQAMVANLAGHAPMLAELPAIADELLGAARPVMAKLARDEARSNFYCLGSGPLLGVAAEGMLKLKEMSLTVSEAFHPMEFRHGPMSMCDETAVVLGLVSPRRFEREVAVLGDMRALGARVLGVGPGQQVSVTSLASGITPVLYLLPLQLLALERSLAKGLDPDSPRHLTAVIHLDQTAGAN